MNYDYPDGSYQRRREIIAEHETYQKGWLYFIANDPRVPQNVQKEMRRWGLPKGRVHRQRALAAPALRPRSAPHGGRLRDDRTRVAKDATDPRFGRHGIVHDRFAQRPDDTSPPRAPSKTKATSASKPTDHTKSPSVPCFPKRRQCGQPRRACLCFKFAYRVRLDPNGTGLYDLGPKRRHGRGDGNRNRSQSVQDVSYDEGPRSRLIADGQILHYDGPVKERDVANQSPSIRLGGIVIDDDSRQPQRSIGKAARQATKFVGWGYRHDRNTNEG